MQFHIEVTDRAVEGFLSAFSSDLEPGRAESIRADTPGALRALDPWRDLLFGRFAALVSQHGFGGGRPTDAPRT